MTIKASRLGKYVLTLVVPAVLPCMVTPLGCSTGPDASETKTNWMALCATTADCEAKWQCLCGVCTTACSADTDCRRGICASELATAATCEERAASASQPRLCLPRAEDDSCYRVALEPDDDLAASEAVSCSEQNALLCESFDAPLPEYHSTWYEAGGEAFVQDCSLQAGSAAIEYRSVGAGTTQNRMRLASSVDSGPLHARFFVNLTEASVLPEQLVIFELWYQQGDEISERITVFLDGQGVPSVFVGSAAFSYPAAEPLVRGEWVCVELGVEVSDSVGSVSLAVDGRRVAQQDGLDTRPPQPFSFAVQQSVPFGEVSAGDVTLFADELVVATSPIGCD